MTDTIDDVAAEAAGQVFAAGAGPGRSACKETMDYGGAVKLIEAAQRAGTRRYVIVSSMGADPDQPNMTASARSWFRAP